MDRAEVMPSAECKLGGGKTVRRAGRAILSACALCAGFALAASAQAPLGGAIDLEDRSGEALAAFHRALHRAEAGEGRARAIVWGASHTASDQYTGPLREEWQARFGDAGPGFVLPVRAFELYEHRGVEVAPRGPWRVARVRGRSRPNRLYGPHGIAMEAALPARAWIELERGAVDEVSIHVLRQAGGGTLEASVAGGPSVSVRTDGAGPDFVTLRSPGAIRRVELRALGDGPVRVFGASLERASPGVIVDSLGIPGTRMRDRLPWEDRTLRAQIEALAPDLVVLAYGTNESGSSGSIAREARSVDAAVRRARELAPGASCVLIGPSDWPMRAGDGTRRERPRTSAISALFRETAARHGCGYFDLVRFMGGPGSMPRWVQAGLALDDHVHFTDEGYERLARALSRALLRGYASP
jgi:lysophospholipase L1-like esterase